MFRCIVAGSRTIMNATAVAEAIHEAQVKWNRKITLGISGAAAGPDTIGAQLLSAQGVEIKYMPAQWNGTDPITGRKYGRRAGIVRNEEMLKIADAVIVVWDGSSRGTAHLINAATAKKLPIHIKRVDPSYKAPPQANNMEVELDVPQTGRTLSLTPPAL